jgi:hypothetical protein
MRSNARIPSAVRCPNCKGWGTVFKVSGTYVPPPAWYNHGLPLGHGDMTPCSNCIGGYRLNVEHDSYYVFCDSHTCIHPAEPDYYEEGETECRKGNWRKVWVELPS